MLDVHPPEHTPHTWRDFFIHIATIVVGLLIAIGLEQFVEAIQHHHQRIELEEALHEDTVKAIQDTENQNNAETAMLQWLNLSISQAQDALNANHPLTASIAPPSIREHDLPDTPAWKAAKSSGLLDLLPQDQVKAYSELATILDQAAVMDARCGADIEELNKLQGRFEHNGVPPPDFSHATRQDLEKNLDALLGVQMSLSMLNQRYKALHGAEVAILKGDRDLNSIQHAERNRW
jgi:hypothetical protein